MHTAQLRTAELGQTGLVITRVGLARERSVRVVWEIGWGSCR